MTTGKGSDKREWKRGPGRPTTKIIKPIPDTFANVIKSLVKPRPAK